MKIFLRTLLAAGIVALTACHAPTTGGDVLLSDFLDARDAQSDAGPAIRAALAHCAEIGAERLVLPGGVLRIRPDRTVEKYQFISNNDEGLKRIAFDLDRQHDFVIEGAGTRLLFTGFVSPFSLEECQNITIRDLTIDFTRTFHSEGVVRAAGPGWLDLEFPEEYRCDLAEGCLRFLDDEGRVYPYSSLLEFDAERREPAFHVDDYWLPALTIPAERRPDGRIRIFRNDLKASVGNILVFGAAHRLNPAFTISDSQGITLRDVTIHHCGGMGVIAQRSRDIELERIHVLPAPGKDRMISITADATHFANCNGYIRLLDCTFENQKDDATNIHGLYMPVEEIIARNGVRLRWGHSGQYGVDFLRPGMRVEVVDNRSLETYARLTVEKVVRINKNRSEVTFKEPLPEAVRPGHLIADDEIRPDVLIRGCRMAGNRARGLLLGSRGKIVIEENYFHIAGAAILFEGDGNFWFEQSGVRDVTIRNNLFENCNFGSRGWGDACIAVGSGIPDRKASRYHRNIRVEGNEFRVFDPRIVSLYCVDGFRFSDDNRILRTEAYPAVFDPRSHFICSECDHIEIPAPPCEKQ